jgi:hypothetical protein
MFRTAPELVQRAARLEAPTHELSAALAVTQASRLPLACLPHGLCDSTIKGERRDPGELPGHWAENAGSDSLTRGKNLGFESCSDQDPLRVPSS